MASDPFTMRRRPNPIGLTVVQLLRREGSRLHVPPEVLRRGWLSEAAQRS